MRQRRFIVPTLFACVAGTSAVAAQETYKQTIVVTAAATPIELGTANRTLTVITREQIRSPSGLQRARPPAAGVVG